MMTGVLLCERKKPNARIRVRELNRNTITLGLRTGDIVRAKDLMHASSCRPLTTPLPRRQRESEGPTAGS
jgi:hypothetical protein